MTIRLLEAFVTLLIIVLLSPGCATQLDQPDVSDEEVRLERLEQLRLALAMRLDRQAHVWKLGSRLRTAGAELCGKNVRYTYGFFAVDRETFAKEYRSVASDLGLGAGVYIWDLREDLQPAAAALGKGDRITTIDGVTVSDFRSFETAMSGPFETGRLSLGLARAATGERAQVSLQGVRGCDYRVAMVEEDSVNAFADGKNVFITTGMFRFTESDDEMSIIVGHELAHNVLGHVTQKRAQVFAGMLLDVALAVFARVYTNAFQQLAAATFSQEMEADADYMGLYLAARAGYRIDGAPHLWRRMAVEYPASIGGNMLATHPSPPKRSVMLKRTIDEVDRKRKAGEPLVPGFE